MKWINVIYDIFLLELRLSFNFILNFYFSILNWTQWTVAARNDVTRNLISFSWTFRSACFFVRDLINCNFERQWIQCFRPREFPFEVIANCLCLIGHEYAWVLITRKSAKIRANSQAVIMCEVNRETFFAQHLICRPQKRLRFQIHSFVSVQRLRQTIAIPSQILLKLMISFGVLWSAVDCKAPHGENREIHFALRKQTSFCDSKVLLTTVFVFLGRQTHLCLFCLSAAFSLNVDANVH